MGTLSNTYLAWYIQHNMWVEQYFAMELMAMVMEHPRATSY